MNLPYAHLRYLFEGYRPSQTNTVTQSMKPLLHVSGLDFQSGISLTLNFLSSHLFYTERSKHTMQPFS